MALLFTDDWHTHWREEGWLTRFPFFFKFYLFVYSLIYLFLFLLFWSRSFSLSPTAGKTKTAIWNRYMEKRNVETVSVFIPHYLPFYFNIFKRRMDLLLVIPGTSSANDDFLLGFRVSPVNIFHSLSRGICLHYFFGFAVVAVKSSGACQREWKFQL